MRQIFQRIERNTGVPLHTQDGALNAGNDRGRQSPCSSLEGDCWRIQRPTPLLRRPRAVHKRVRTVGFFTQSNALLGSFENQCLRTLAAQPIVFEPVSTFDAIRRRGRVKNEDTPFPQVTERFRALGIRAVIQHFRFSPIRPATRRLHNSISSDSLEAFSSYAPIKTTFIFDLK